MSNLLGEASAVAHTAAAPARKSRKRKDKYQLSDEESGRPFPSSSRTYPQRYRDNADSSSDGFELMDAGGVASSGDDADWAASPRKKARTTGNMTNMPPIASLQVKSDHEDGDVDYDASFDTAFDDIDMEALTDAELPSATKSKLNNGAARVKKEELDNVGLPPKPKSLKPTNGVKKEEGPPSWLSTYDSLAVAKTEDEGIGSSSKSTGAPSATPTATSGSVDALEPDGSLRFFWIDYLELDGKIYFIGKVKDKKSGAWASCCITVENLERNLFVLPRERKVEEVMVGDSSDEESEEEEPVKDEDEEDDEGEKEERKKASAKRKVKRRRELKMVETDDIPEMVDVYQDFDQVRRKAGIKKFKAKFVDRLYAFGEKDVPREKHKWLKVVYGFDGLY
jgi:DNA polymerase alpha subunit A